MSKQISYLALAKIEASILDNTERKSLPVQLSRNLGNVLKQEKNLKNRLSKRNA